jgi:acetylornithine deacetylase/succinyl-diaminopimelate desuccinylase-like protein
MTLRRLVAAALAALVALPAHAAGLRDDVRAWRAAHERDVVESLVELARYRSVAADPAGMAAMAARLQDELTRRGFSARQLPTAAGAPPLVYGELKTPGAGRTVVFYAHYDGQPVNPADWRSDPFEPVIRTGVGADAGAVDWRAAKPPFDPEWRLFGRSVSDDKSSIAAFLAAYDALKASGRAPSVNIKVLWEGEEERNSPHLEAALRANRDLLAADLWLIGDAPVHQSRARMVYFGARGAMGLEATVFGPERALHDGHYGNWAPNPAAELVQLIAAMRGPDGRILIPRFTDDVRPLTPAERAAIAALPHAEPQLMRDFGVAAAESDEALTLATMRPAINLRGLRSGQVGAAAANAISVDATASIDFRLVPGQTVAGVRGKVEAFLEARGWTLVDHVPTAAERAARPRLIRLEWDGGYPALRSDMASPAARAVIAAAGRAGEGPLAVLPMMGGSVPIYLFAEVFGVPVIGLPVANHDNSQHAANENTRLANLWDGVDTYAAMMGDLRW